jgi:hypothetical protein
LNAESGKVEGGKISIIAFIKTQALYHYLEQSPVVVLSISDANQSRAFIM